MPKQVQMGDNHVHTFDDRDRQSREERIVNDVLNLALNCRISQFVDMGVPQKEARLLMAYGLLTYVAEMLDEVLDDEIDASVEDSLFDASMAWGRLQELLNREFNPYIQSKRGDDNAPTD